MPSRFTPIDLSRVQTHPLAGRRSLVMAEAQGRPWRRGGGLSDFLDSLPDLLGAADLKAVIRAVAEAAAGGKTVILAMGAHVIKVGLSPLIIDLMERGVVSAVALNGAGIVHDFELAATGATSEDVADAIRTGRFGMARETGEFLGMAARGGAGAERGLGRAVGEAIGAAGLPHEDRSILAAGARLDIPVTVHVAMGTDIIHMHPGFDPAATGAASHVDFRLLAAVIATLEDGVYLNVGSAVVLPEVFLKAVSLVRNLGHPLKRFTAVNIDFIRQYRPLTNVVGRPVESGGRGINLVGHHEILLPLIAAGVIEAMAGE